MMVCRYLSGSYRIKEQANDGHRNSPPQWYSEMSEPSEPPSTDHGDILESQVMGAQSSLITGLSPTLWFYHIRWPWTSQWSHTLIDNMDENIQDRMLEANAEQGCGSDYRRERRLTWQCRLQSRWCSSWSSRRDLREQPRKHRRVDCWRKSLPSPGSHYSC